MFILFLLIVVALSVGFVLADQKEPVSQEKTYILYGVVALGLTFALVHWGLLALVLYYFWHNGKIYKWFLSLK